MFSYKTTLLFWLLLTCSWSHADSYKEDLQTWGNITAVTALEKYSPDLKNVKLWLEAQGRFADDSSEFSQGILRTALGYYFEDNLSFWLGYGWIPNDPVVAGETFDEHRIWQQLLWTEKLTDGNFMSRTRLEQRFDERGDDVGWRFRQFFKYYQPTRFSKKLSWVLWNEVFVDINQPDWKIDNGFDQNRAFAGLGYQFVKNVRTEFGYINQFVRKPSTSDVMNHIVSFNLFF